jgi:GNAT superfamily N-acetyltransferase
VGGSIAGARARAAARVLTVPGHRESIVVTPAGPEHADALSALFDRSDVACHCRYWHFAGNTNAWLARCAHERDTNRREMTSALVAGSDEMSGIVALEQARAVGWLKLAPATQVPKIYAQRLYRNLPCFGGPREGIATVGCLLVEPASRRRGVATALVKGAVKVARERGARAIEAFPRRAEGLREEEMWTGPFETYLREGFEVVHDFGPYPVLRLEL